MKLSYRIARTAALAFALAASGLALTACSSADLPTPAAPDHETGVNLPLIGLNNAGPAEAAPLG
jgi:hypothetical protein